MTQEILLSAESCPMTFDLKDILAWLIPVLISVAAITVARRAVTRSLRPVLVFVRRGTDRVWFIENVGTGPALDAVVAEQDWDEKKWRRSLLLPPIAKDGQLRLRSAPSVFGV